jgi:DNA polymerase III delta subunit
VIYVLYGADVLSLRRRLDQLKAEVGPTREEQQNSLTVLEARDARVHDILGPAMMPPFLAAKRMVIVEGFLDRVSAEGRGNRGLAAYEPLWQAIQAGLPPTTLLVFTNGALDSRGGRRGNPTLEHLKKLPGVTVEEFPELKGQQYQRFIREEANVRGIKFRGGASSRPLPEGEEWRRPPGTDPVALLADMHPGDTLSIANELDKLALYTLGREATVDDVVLVCAGERDFTMFQFTDALQDGDFRLALKAYEIIDREGKEWQRVIATVITAYRQAIEVFELAQTGLDDKAIGQAIRLPYDNLVKQRRIRAQRHGIQGLKRAVEAIVETDRRVKLGEIKPPELGMEVLIAKLASIAPAPPSRPRERAYSR